MWRKHGIAWVGIAPVLVLVCGGGCRGPEFRAGQDVPDVESCEPAPDAKVGADCGVFVRAGAQGSGSLGAPVGSITEALSLGDRVYVCGALVDEVVRVSTDVEIFGGLDCEVWAWNEEERTELTAPAGEVPMTIASGVSASFSGLRFAARNALEASSSSIAVIAEEGADVRFERCDLVAGNAADGAEGAPGDQGDEGAPGEPGSSSVGGTGGLSSCLSEGGKGGNPGTSGTANGSSGLPVAQANGGSLGCTSGSSGFQGGAGQDADAVAAAPRIEPGGYRNELGSAGSPGMPGGGGGGGGGIVGAAGGGGGAGGCAGGGGEPGGFGGASITLISLGASVAFEDSTAIAGNGGHGARGGAGGEGGGKGAGGAGHEAACSGASGGRGGKGGSGADGVGGPAIIVAYVGAQPSLNGLDVTAPIGGQAGESPTGEPAAAAVALSFDEP